MLKNWKGIEMRRKNVNALLFFLEQVPIVLTVVIAALAAVASGVFPLEVNIQLSLVLAVIGLMATSELIEKHRDMRQISDDVRKTRSLVEKQAGGLISADTFFGDGKTILEPFIENASEICLLGASLMSPTGALCNALRSYKTIDNIHIRIIVIKSEEQVLAAASKRHGDSDVETWRLWLGVTTKNLEDLRRRLGTNATLEARTIIYPPAYTISM